MAKKLSREELEKDEVAEGLHSTLQWVMDHRTSLLTTILVAAALAVGVANWNSRAEASKERAGQTLNNANKIFSELPTLEDAKERETRLNGLITSLQEQIADHPGSPTSRAALYLKGNCHFYNDDYDKAIEAYKQYAAEGADAEERARGEYAVAASQENKSFLTKDPHGLEEAAAGYDRAEKAAPPKSYLAYAALLGRARVMERLGKKDDALAIYKRVAEERPAPVKASDPDAKGKDERGDIGTLVRRQIEKTMGRESFQAIAKDRIARLEAGDVILAAAAPAPAIATPAAGDAKTTATQPVAAPVKPLIEQPVPVAEPAKPAAPPAKPE